MVKKEIYTEKQSSALIIILFSAFIIFMTMAFIYGWGDNPITLPVYLVMVPIMLLPMVMFYNMRTVVDQKYIYIIYGAGFIRKVMPLKDISDVAVTKVPWYNGAGIKYTRRGKLYSINFTSAVWLKVRAGQAVMIGSKNPELLAGEIRKRIGG